MRASSTGKTRCGFIINLSRHVNREGDQPNPVIINHAASVYTHNHDLLRPEEAKLLRPARFIPDTLRASLLRLARQPGLTETNINRLLMDEALEKKLDLTWTLEDVRQVAYETRGNHATGDAARAVEVLRKLAADGHATYDVKLGGDGQLVSVVWQMARQVRA